MKAAVAQTPGLELIPKRATEAAAETETLSETGQSEEGEGEGRTVLLVDDNNVNMRVNLPESSMNDAPISALSIAMSNFVVSSTLSPDQAPG